ncbi:hypothetical protein INT45_006308, partial [Circinella minor]
MRTIDRGTQNAEILPTFQAAARRCVILVFCHPDNPYNLWLSHRDSMTEDYLHTAQVVNEHNAADNNEPAIIREHRRLAAQLALQPEQQF